MKFITANKILITFIIISGLAGLMMSCQTPNQPKKPEDKKPEKKEKIQFPEGEKIAVVNDPHAEEVNAEKFTSEHKKSVDIIPSEKTSSVQKSQGDKKQFYHKFIEDGKEKEKIKVSVNLDGAAIGDVVPVFASVLKFNYLIDPEVTGTTTMFLNSEMTREELWQVFIRVLRLCGAYCAPAANDMIKIIPFAKLPQQQRLEIDFKPTGTAEVLIYELKNTASKDIVKYITPFLTKGATATELEKQNSVLIVDIPSNIPKLYSLLKAIDVEEKNGWQRAIIRCDNIAASRIMNELAEIMPILGFPVSIGEKFEPGTIALTSLDRLQLVAATAANAEALEELKKWVNLLDSSDSGEQEKVFIYKVINGKASELIQALSVIFQIEGTTMASDSKSSGGQTSSAKSVGNSQSTSSSKSSKNGNKDSGPASVFEIPVRVFADAVHNRLVIRTTPRTYAMMRALLKRLDTVPAQVLLQVLVAEVTLTDSSSFGVELSYQDQNAKTSSLIATDFKNLAPKGDTKYGLSYLLQDTNNDKTFAQLQALAGKTRVKIISSPQLLVASHAEAKISVGDKVPIITSEITDTQSTTEENTSLRRSIQYEDTGIILQITPHVTKGNLIEVEMEQTVSEAVKTTTTTIDSPTIQERVLKTSMSLRNGKTILIGGLIKEQLEDEIESLPMIIDIPFLRHLLGSSGKTVKRTEMIILITGYIVKEDSDLEKILERYRESVEVLKKLQPMPTQSDEDAPGIWLW